MPLSEHYKGAGTKVMASMKKQYGAEKGKRVFYATEKKHEAGHEAGQRELATKRK